MDYPNFPFPSLAFVSRPTPVEAVPLASHGRGSPQLFIKRDDLTSPLGGGNKTRKLDLLLAAAQARGCRRVLTVGAWGSNHVVACGVHAATLGMATTAVVVPQPLTPEVFANLRAGARLGIRYVPVANTAALPVAVIAAARDAEREDGCWPYPIPAGGSSPLGALGYIAAAFELRDQVREGQLPRPTYAVCPAGTGGTVAGLALGLRLAGLATRVVGVTVYHPGVTNPATTALLANRALALLRRAGGARGGRPGATAPPLGWLRPADVTVLQGFRGPGYAVPTEASQRAVAWARDHAGLRLETTYSGKAFAAALDLAGQLHRDESVLFVHTFGPPR